MTVSKRTQEVELTDQQNVFLTALFDETVNPDLDPDIAKLIAGYPESQSSITIIRDINERLVSDVYTLLLGRAPLAAKKIIDIIRDPNPMPGSEKVLAAATQILDRAGVIKKDKSELTVKMPDGVIVLPALNLE